MQHFYNIMQKPRCRLCLNFGCLLHINFNYLFSIYSAYHCILTFGSKYHESMLSHSEFPQLWVLIYDPDALTLNRKCALLAIYACATLVNLCNQGGGENALNRRYGGAQRQIYSQRSQRRYLTFSSGPRISIRGV